jgi:MEMO1 family protein
MSSLDLASLRTGARVRPPAVAGTFYPAAPDALTTSIERALAEARGMSLPAPKALVVPHAGYVYSGPVAAHAYRLLREHAEGIRRVVLLGPCHRVPVRGLALPRAEAFDTPLGRVALDREGIEAIDTLAQVTRSETAHAHEHALEVQLPFLQRALGPFTLLPLAVGDASAHEVAEVLDRVWGGDETLVVVSTDLSHYLRHAQATALDAATARTIVALDPRLDHEQACGATPLAGLLIAARQRGLVVTLLDLRNSGDTAGDRERVVGYAAFALHDPERALRAFDAERGHELLGIARRAIEGMLAGSTIPPRATDDWLGEPRATFVTLRQGETLRGCIGSLEARRPLAEDVAANAKAAATSDPRFPPLAADELERTTIEVSLLSTPEPIAFADRDDLLAQFVPGVDGIVLACGVKRATFLPQVWSTVDDRGAFLDELMRKAGLPPAFPLDRCTLQRYRVRKWSE